MAPGSCPLTPRGGGRAFVSWCSRSRSRRRSGIRGLPQLSSTASSCRSPPRPPQSAGSSPWADDASGQLFYRASARRRALGPRRAVGPTGRGGACCEGSARSGRLDRKVGTGRLDSAGRCARREAVARAGAPRLLPVQDRAGTGASGGDVTFLAGISSRPVDRCESPLHTNCVRVVAPHRRAGVPGRPGGGVCSAAVQPRWVFYTCIVH